MKEKKGISLIVLIITIIVMIIIAGAIIISLTGSGIIDQAEEATFKTQVRGIQDALVLKKTYMMAEAEGNISSYDLKLSDLGLDEEIFEKFKSKLFISGTGELLYQQGNVTDKEEQWLIDLGIHGGNGIVTGSNFVSDVTLLSNQNKMSYGATDYYTVLEQVGEYYPNTVVLYSNSSELKHLYSAEKNVLMLAYNYREENVLKQLKQDYFNNASSVDLTEEIETKVRADLGENENAMYKTIVDSIFGGAINTVKDLIDELEKRVQNANVLSDSYSYILINDEEIVLLQKGVVTPNYNPEPIIVKESESAFTYTMYEDDDFGTVASITGYNGNVENVKVPGVIIKNNNDIVIVKKIAANALNSTKPAKLELTSTVLSYVTQDAFGTDYDGTSVNDLKLVVSNIGGTVSTTKTYENTREGKNALVMDSLMPQFIGNNDPAEYVEIVGEGDNQELWGVVTVNTYSTPTFYPLATEEITTGPVTVEISEGIVELETSLIGGRWVNSVKLPTTLTTVSDTALSGGVVKNVTSELTFEQIEEFDSDASNGILGSTCKESNYEQIQ